MNISGSATGLRQLLRGRSAMLRPNGAHNTHVYVIYIYMHIHI